MTTGTEINLPTQVKHACLSKPTLARQLFIKNFCTESNGNPTKGLVAYTRSQRHGRTGRRMDAVSASGLIFLLRKESPKTKERQFVTQTTDLGSIISLSLGG
jgi:hypothetical protein